MEKQIVRKIRKVLETGIRTECQAVYLLVQVRKLLDRGRPKAKPFKSLRMYCDWAVHVELDRAQAKTIVQRVADLYPRISRGDLNDAEKFEFARIFSLNQFQEDLQNFLSAHRLPQFSAKAWNAFFACFLNVIEDCSLVWRDRGTVKAVDELVVVRHVGRTGRVPDGSPHWAIWALLSGGKFKMTVGGEIELSAEIEASIDTFLDEREQRAAQKRSRR